MKKQNVRQNAGQTALMENKSVSSKVTIRNSTTLIERSETGKEKQKPEPARAMKQKPEPSDYEETFLRRHIMEKGVSVYVSQQIKDEIACIVGTITGNSLPLSAYIDNIIRHHLDTHRDEIDALFEQQFRKRFER